MSTNCIAIVYYRPHFHGGAFFSPKRDLYESATPWRGICNCLKKKMTNALGEIRMLGIDRPIDRGNNLHCQNCWSNFRRGSPVEFGENKEWNYIATCTNKSIASMYLWNIYEIPLGKGLKRYVCKIPPPPQKKGGNFTFWLRYYYLTLFVFSD